MWRGSAIARQRCGAGSEFGRALGTHKPSRGARHSRSLGTLLLLLLLLALAELAQAQRGGARSRRKQGGYAEGLYDEPPLSAPVPTPTPTHATPAGSPSPATFAAPSLGLPEFPTLPKLPALPGLPSLWSVVPSVQLPGWLFGLAVEAIVPLVVYVAVGAGVLYGTKHAAQLLYRSCARAWAYCVQINWCRGRQCDDGHWYRVRDQVWVRDQLHEQWKRATVVGFQESVVLGGVHPLCQPAGPAYTRGHTYAYVEKRDPARGHIQPWGSSLWAWLSPSPEHATAQTESDSDDDFASPRGEPRRLPGSPMQLPDRADRSPRMDLPGQPDQDRTTLVEGYKKHAAAMSPGLVANPFSPQPVVDAGLSLEEHVKVLSTINHDSLSQTLSCLAKAETQRINHEHASAAVDAGYSPDSVHSHHAPLQSTATTLGLSYSRFEEPTTWESAVRPQARVLARLVCVGGDGRDYDICQNQIVLGRQPTGKTPKAGATPDFVVSSDKTVSRRHAKITCSDYTAEEPSSFQLECLCKNSKGKLLVNKVPVEQGAKKSLHSGDIIEIGSIRLRFQRATDQRGASPNRVSPRANSRGTSRSPTRRGTSQRGSPLWLEPAGTPAYQGRSPTRYEATRTGTDRSMIGGGPSLVPRRQLGGAVHATLRAVDDGSLFQITRPETIVGRNCDNPKADCLLRRDKLISREHLRIRVDTAPTGATAYQEKAMRVGPTVPGNLEVTVIMCAALCPADSISHSNPKVRVAMEPTSRELHGWKSTATARNTVHPSYEETIRLRMLDHPNQAERTLCLEVVHDESSVGTPVLLGQLTLDLDLEGDRGCFGGDWTKTVDKVWALQDPHHQVPDAWYRQKQRMPQNRSSKDDGYGSVHLRVRFTPDEPMQHASALSSSQTRFWLECIGRNHAIINGQTLPPDRGPRELFNRDKIMVGSVSFDFEVGTGRSPDGLAPVLQHDSRQPSAPRSQYGASNRRDQVSPNSSTAQGGMLNAEDRKVIDAIFDFIDVEGLGELNLKNLKQFQELQHDPEVFEYAMDGVLDDLLRTAPGDRRRLARGDFIDYFAKLPSTHRLMEVLSLFREKWVPEWASMTYVERQVAAKSAQFHMPPQLADLSQIREELKALIARSSASGGLSSSVLSQDVGHLVAAADRKMRSGTCHPNKMLDWLLLFQHPKMTEAARNFRRIADITRLPLSETYVNAVDSVWMVNGRFRPGNPNVPKRPPSTLPDLEDKIEGGEFDVNEYIVGDEDRKRALGIRGEDRLTPLLLLATGQYMFEQPTFDLMKMLLDRDADANVADARGFNALFYLVERGPWTKAKVGLERITRQLLERTDLSHRDDTGRTVLHILVERHGSETKSLRPILMQKAGQMRLDSSERDSLEAKLARLDEQGGTSSASSQRRYRERTGDTQKAARVVMEHLRDSKKRLRDIKAMFQEMDANGDGKLSAMEFAKGLRQQTHIGYEESLECADSLMAVMDRDRSNSISIDEFINTFKAEQIVRKFKEKLRGEDPHRVFDAIDTNKDGVLSRAEFVRALQDLKVTRGMDSSQIDHLMDLVDMDGDDAIDFVEFLEIVRDGKDDLGTAGSSRDSRYSDRQSDYGDHRFERRRERRGSNASHHSVASHRSDRSSRHDRQRELDDVRQARETKLAATALDSSWSREQQMAEAQRVTKEVIEQLIRATKRSGSKIKREFRKMDKDKNGKLSTKEFASGLRNLLGVDAATSWDYVNAMMPILDVDGGESLTVKPAGS